MFFAGYRIERVLGRGGMGTVYLVRHPRLPRYDALKVLPSALSEDPEYCARFEREAETAARLDHPNIVTVWDRGIEDGCLWIAMRFVDGVDAAVLLRRMPSGMSPESALHIVVAAARGLDEAHRAGLLHRDVKPANILIESRPGGPDRVYVADFGIARSVAQTTALTRPGSVLATLAYAAPEQIEAAALDRRVDVYALGCTLYELLTGAKPFPRARDVEVLVAQLYEAPPRATTSHPALPPAIDEVIVRAMAKNPADRYDSCGELAAAAVAAFAGSAGTAARRRRPRWRAAAALALGTVVALVAVILGVRGVLAEDTRVSSAPASNTPSTTSGASAITWSNYAFMVEAFPELLPPTPVSSGFQSTRCVPVNADLTPLEPDSPLPALAQLQCRGNGDPAEHIVVACNTDRSASTVPLDADTTVSGDERWARSSGGGRLVWWNTTGDSGKVGGALVIQFDDPARSFCRLVVTGGSSGRELVDRWFAVAPV